MEVRKHGRWKLVDWLWLAPFVLVMSLWPRWRKRYWSRYVTVSVLTDTIYSPDGSISPDLRRHEEFHAHQRDRDGLFWFVTRYVLSTRWRIWYEAEAYYVQGRDADGTTAALMDMYMVRWPRQHVMALVLWARSRMRLRGL